MHTSSNLFNVAQFQADYVHLTGDEVVQAVPELENEKVDISVNDVILITKFEAVEQQIQKELIENSLKIEASEHDRVDAASKMAAVVSHIDEQRATWEQNALQNLESYKEHQAMLQSRDDKKKKKPKIIKEVNYITSNMKSVRESIYPFEPIAPNEVILSVAIYHQKSAIKLQEFLVIGSNKLTDLKDKIYCLSDFTLDGPLDLSENTFYNDMRAPPNDGKEYRPVIDYSRYIIDWVNENERYTQPGLGIFTSKLMQDVCFRDLSIRLNVPYLYLHQGNCEHIIAFTCLRMAHDQDERNSRLYPLHVFQSKIRRKKCTICDIYSAKFVTYDDKLSLENPCYYCDNCYKPLHYTVDGKLLYDDYKVYPYHHE